jgi:hypothetical protein
MPCFLTVSLMIAMGPSFYRAHVNNWREEEHRNADLLFHQTGSEFWQIRWGTLQIYEPRGIQPGTKAHAMDTTNASIAPAVIPAMLLGNAMFMSDRGNRFRHSYREWDVFSFLKTILSRTGGRGGQANVWFDGFLKRYSSWSGRSSNDPQTQVNKFSLFFLSVDFQARLPLNHEIIQSAYRAWKLPAHISDQLCPLPMSHILLLRSPNETTPDPYERILGEASYSAHSISVLETSFTNLQSLQHLIAAGPGSKGYVGVIITSKRSCEALTTTAKILSDQGPHSRPSLSMFRPFVRGISEAYIFVQSLGLRFPSTSSAKARPLLWLNFRPCVEETL